MYKTELVPSIQRLWWEVAVEWHESILLIILAAAKIWLVENVNTKWYGRKKKKLENFRYYTSNFKWGICLVAQQRKQMVVNQTLNYYTFDQLKFTTLCNKYWKKIWKWKIYFKGKQFVLLQEGKKDSIAAISLFHFWKQSWLSLSWLFASLVRRINSAEI